MGILAVAILDLGLALYVGGVAIGLMAVCTFRTLGADVPSDWWRDVLLWPLPTRWRR